MAVALVTCGHAGPGRAIVEELADQDVDVILTARDDAAARAAAERLWDEGLDTVHPRVLDPSSPSTLAKLRDKIGQDFGVLDILVLCGLDGEEERERIRAGLAHVMRADARVISVDGDDPGEALRRLASG